MFGLAFRQLRLDAAAVEGVAVRLRIIAAVALHKIRLPPWAAGPTAHGRHCVHQGKRCVMSFRLAAVSCAASGIPWLSVRR
jgi:hypothetical protein